VRLHIDVLGWLHVAAGLFALAAGLSLSVLAAGTFVVLAERAGAWSSPPPGVWFLVLAAITFVTAGGVTVAVGRALVRRRRLARLAALVVAVPSLVALPFGTALGIYTFWTLLNDEARREFHG
jgi:hypothetical protein